MGTSNFNSGVMILAHIERAAIDVKFELAVEELDSIEQGKINFNTDFVNANLEVVTENKEEKILTYTIIADYDDVNKKYIYNMPSLINPQIYSYVDNGVNYEFKGFKHKETGEMYYGSELETLIATIEEETTLVAIWQAVEYTLQVLTKGENTILNYNGYTSNLEGASIKIKFTDTVKVPSIIKTKYSSSYVFMGYNFSVGNEKITTDGFNKTVSMLSGYETFNQEYTKKAQNKVVTIEPDYSDVVYKIEFNSKNLNDKYKTYLEYEENEYDKITVEYSISEILNDTYLVPVSYREHHTFLGYKNVTKEIMIDYENSIFNYQNNTLYENDDIFVLNSAKGVNKDIYLDENGKYYYNEQDSYEAIYEVNKFVVRIINDDYKTNAKLEYSIETLNSLENVDYEINESGEILISMPYDTTSFNMPKLSLIDTNYQFNGYVYLSEEEYKDYTTSYVFTESIDLYLKVSYKVKYVTKTGEILDSYYLKTELQTNEYGYEFYAGYNDVVTLPKVGTVELGGQVSLTGRELVGFRENGETLKESYITVTKPTSIEFMYKGQTYEITITSGYETVFPNSIATNKYIDEYTKVSDTEVIIKVVFDDKTNNYVNTSDVQKVLPKLELNGHTFKGYVFNSPNETKIVNHEQHM